MKELETLRRQIRELDAQIIELVGRRNQLARTAGQVKRRENLPLQNFGVEREVLENALARASGANVEPETARALVRLLIQSAVHAQERDKPAHPTETRGHALIIGGAGLMGQWFCRFLTERGYEVYVDDPHPGPYPPGRLGDRPYDLVLVATPPSTVPEVMQEVAQKVSDGALVADIASVKGDLVPVLRRLAASGKKMASLHPMFGPDTEVLMGRNVLVMDAGNPAAAQEAGRLFAATTANTVPVPLERHDEIMATVLTLSHATSLVFNHAFASAGHTWKELEPFASTTFRRQTDVSRDVARENPNLYFEIQSLNPHSERVLDQLERSLRLFREAVRSRDLKAFEAYMAQGGRAYAGGN